VDIICIMDIEKQRGYNSRILYNDARKSLLQYVGTDLDYKYSIILIGPEGNGKTFLLKECADFLKNYIVDEDIGFFPRDAIKLLKTKSSIITSFCFDPYKKFGKKKPDNVKIIDMSMIEGNRLQ